MGAKENKKESEKLFAENVWYLEGNWATTEKFAFFLHYNMQKFVETQVDMQEKIFFHP